jgi:hypothetical protein
LTDLRVLARRSARRHVNPRMTTNRFAILGMKRGVQATNGPLDSVPSYVSWPSTYPPTSVGRSAETTVRGADRRWPSGPSSRYSTIACPIAAGNCASVPAAANQPGRSRMPATNYPPASGSRRSCGPQDRPLRHWNDATTSRLRMGQPFAPASSRDTAPRYGPSNQPSFGREERTRRVGARLVRKMGDQRSLGGAGRVMWMVGRHVAGECGKGLSPPRRAS